MSDFRREEDEFFSVSSQRAVVIPYRRFGTNFRVRFASVKNKKGRRSVITTIRCVIAQKNAVDTP
jgi:hypothetical protein